MTQPAIDCNMFSNLFVFRNQTIFKPICPGVTALSLTLIVWRQVASHKATCAITLWSKARQFFQAAKCMSGNDFSAYDKKPDCFKD